MRRFAFGLILLSLGVSTHNAAAADKDYCQESRSFERTTIILDRSAAYAADDVDRFNRGYSALRREIEDKFKISGQGTGLKLEIWPVLSYTAQTRALFSACLPMCPKDISIFDSCQQREIQRDRRRFWDKAAAVLDARLLEMRNESQGESPLSETIGKVVRETAPSTLVIYSDFLERHHGGGGLKPISFYSLNPNEWDAYQKTLAKGNYIPDLHGIQVTAYGFGSEIGGQSNQTPRKGLSDGHWRTVYKWWVRFFQEAGTAGFTLEREYPGVLPPEPPPPQAPSDRAAR